MAKSRFPEKEKARGYHSGNTPSTPRQPAGVIALASSLTFHGATASCYGAARHAYFHPGINAVPVPGLSNYLPVVWKFTSWLVHSERKTQQESTSAKWRGGMQKMPRITFPLYSPFRNEKNVCTATWIVWAVKTDTSICLCRAQIASVWIFMSLVKAAVMISLVSQMRSKQSCRLIQNYWPEMPV